jgi:hypothetical protein
LHLVMFLLSVKVVVFAGFWLAYAYESAGDARLEDHVVVTPLDLRKNDEASVELRSMFPTRRKPAAATATSTGWSPRRTSSASRDEAAGWWPRLSPRKSPRVAPADGGGAFLFNASPRVAPDGVPVRTQASLSWSPSASPRQPTRVEPIGAARQRASPSTGIAPDASPRPQGASRDEAAGFWSRFSPQKSPRIAPQGGGEILLQASPRIAPEGLPVQSQASRVSPRIAPDV